MDLENVVGLPLHIMLDIVNGFIKGYDGTKYLAFFDPEEYDVSFDRIRYLIELKSGIIYVSSFIILLFM